MYVDSIGHFWGVLDHQDLWEEGATVDPSDWLGLVVYRVFVPEERLDQGQGNNPTGCPDCRGVSGQLLGHCKYR